MTSRAIAIEFNYSNENIEGFSKINEPLAIGNMDGTWWVDVDRVIKLANFDISVDPYALAGIMYAKLLLAALPHLELVSKERSDEIALEYGAKLMPDTVITSTN